MPGNEIKIAEHEVLVRGPAVFSGYALSERLPFTRDGICPCCVDEPSVGREVAKEIRVGGWWLVGWQG